MLFHDEFLFYKPITYLSYYLKLVYVVIFKKLEINKKVSLFFVPQFAVIIGSGGDIGLPHYGLKINNFSKNSKMSFFYSFSVDNTVF